MQLQSQFQRFLYQTLCVFSQMKDTKHIRRMRGSRNFRQGVGGGGGGGPGQSDKEKL